MSDATPQDPTGSNHATPDAGATPEAPDTGATPGALGAGAAPGAPGAGGAGAFPGPTARGSGGADGSAATRSWLALVAIVVVVGALVAGAIAVARSSDDKTVQVGGSGGGGTPRRLSLLRGGANAEKAAGAMSPAADAMYYREIQYRLAGDLPNLGTTAPVYQLVAPAMDAARVTAMAKAAGISGTATSQGDGWQVSDGSSRALYVAKLPGGWSVSMSGMVMSSSGSSGASGSSGSSSSGPSGGSGGSPGAPTAVPGEAPPGAERGGVDPSAGTGNAPETAIAPDALVDPVPVPQMPPAPANLPDAAKAEKLARDLLQAMGVLDGEWVVTARDGASGGVAYACAPNADCPVQSTTSVVYSRSVEFERKVGGVRVSGLSWWVEVGDGGRIDSLSGTLTKPEKVSDYPLRSTRSAYDDLVAGKGFFPGPVPMMGAADTPVAVAAMEGSSGGGVAKGSPVPDSVTAMPDIAPQIDPATGTGGSSTSGGGTSAGSGTGGGTGGTEPAGGGPDPGAPSACPKPAPDPSGREPAIACVDPIPLPPDSTSMEPPISIAPTVVTVTGAELSASVFPAWENGTSVGYIVPTYRLLGRYDDGSEWSSELLAIDPALVTEVDPSVPVDPTEPAEPPPGPSGEPGRPPSSVPLPVDPVDPVDPPGPTPTSPPITFPPTSVMPTGPGATTVYVSNQSFTVTPVDVTVEIDGARLASDSFEVGSQHTFVPFATELSAGTHTLTAVSEKGGAKASKTFTVSGPTWISVFFSTDDGSSSLQIQVQDTPMAFA